MNKKPLTTDEEIDLLDKALGHTILDPVPELWLNTGSSRLNAVLGSETLGLPYGKLVELFGPNSNGKTMLALLLTALAQADGATVGWADFENSLDQRWAEAHGVKYDQVYKFKRRVVKDKDVIRLQTTEEVWATILKWMRTKAKVANNKMLLVVDSLAAMGFLEEQAEAGIENRNMRTQMSLPKFLSQAMPEWVGLAQNLNCTMILINQIRVKPIAFGNPEYTPGGYATGFYASIRVEMRRVKGGRLVKAGKVVGLRGTLKNVKNKAGGGSLEGEQTGYEMWFGKKHWKFPTVQDVKKEKEDD